MASTGKKNSKIDPQQRELIENAQRRIRQKKALTRHIVTFVAGSILFIILNVVLNIGVEIKPLGIDWFVWAILIWLFFILIHIINVFVVNQLMGKEWEDRQLEKLVEKQQQKIEKLQLKAEKEHPYPKKDEPSQDDDSFKYPPLNS